MSDQDGSALDVLAKAAQVLAVGTGESQLHAAAEHVAVALGADSVSLLALLSDPDFVYLVADSEELDTGRMRYALGPVPAHPARARGGRGDDDGRRRSEQSARSPPSTR